MYPLLEPLLFRPTLNIDNGMQNPGSVERSSSTTVDIDVMIGVAFSEKFAMHANTLATIAGSIDANLSGTIDGTGVTMTGGMVTTTVIMQKSTMSNDTQNVISIVTSGVTGNPGLSSPGRLRNV